LDDYYDYMYYENKSEFIYDRFDIHVASLFKTTQQSTENTSFAAVKMTVRV